MWTKRIKEPWSDGEAFESLDLTKAVRATDKSFIEGTLMGTLSTN